MAKKPFEAGGIAETNTFVDATDTTKKLAIDVGGTTGVTGTLATAFTTAKTITFPDATTTVVGTDVAQTLTSKTLTSPVISTISNTGTLTLPTSTDTLVGRATTDTLTNKTISGSNNTISNISLTSGVTGTLPIANGGTNITTYTSGDILYASATNTLSKLAKGTDGQVLTLASGVPSWAAAAVTYSAPTIGSTSISSGSTVTSIAGLTLNATSTTSITANTATTVDTNALAGFTTGKYIVSIKQGTKIRSSEVIIQTDGTSVDLTEYGITETGGTISGVAVSATTVSTNAVLQVTITDATTTNATVKLFKVLI